MTPNLGRLTTTTAVTVAATRKETMNTLHHRWGIGLAAAAALALTGCTAAPAAVESTSNTVDAATPRVALTYDGGILVLDAATLEVEADLPIDGFNRLSAAGDGRHVMVSTEDGFRVLDLGTWTDESGEHHIAEPELTDLTFDAVTPGHVVRHAGKTILYDDGTSNTTIFESADLLDGSMPKTEVIEGIAAHHGVSIELEDGTVLTTLGNAEGRNGIQVLDSSRSEIDRNEECPNVHGEGAAANEVVVVGCSDGVLVVDGAEITKLASPDAFGRIGNQYVTESSSIAVGDYNSNPDAEGYLLSQLSIIDTEAKTLEVVDLPGDASYTWRDVARGPNDEALVLSSDGSLYVLDAATGSVIATYDVVEPWEGPVEWQNPHPALMVLGGIAFVTEPASNAIHAIDIATGEIVSMVELPETPNEIAIVTG